MAGTNISANSCSPYKFEAPWSAFEFSYHVLDRRANLVILSMAWMSRIDARTFSRTPNEPDMETLCYWLSRLEPVIRAEDMGEIIVVICNRCGVEDESVYAGTSCVLGIDGGEVKLYGILGRGEKELLVVDTDTAPYAKLVAESPSPQVEHYPVPGFSSRQSHDSAKADSEHATTDRDKLGPVSIDSILAAPQPISPVSPSSTTAFFSSQPTRTEENLGAVKSTSSRRPESRTTTPSLNPAGGLGISSTLATAAQTLSRQTIQTASRDRSPPRSPRSPTDKPVRSHNIPGIRPPSARSARLQDDISIPVAGFRSTQDLDPLEIVGIIDLSVRDEVDSASSMHTNAPWDPNPSYFRADDMGEIIKSSSPAHRGGYKKPETPPRRPRHTNRQEHIPVPISPVTYQSEVGAYQSDTPSRRTGPPTRQEMPPSAASMYGMKGRGSSPGSTTKTATTISSSVANSTREGKRPTSPKSRNVSRTRPQEQPPALVGVDLGNEPVVNDINMPTPAQPSPEQPAPGGEPLSRQTTTSQSTSGHGPTTGELSVRNEHSLSPRPKSMVW
jgi:hypothetical protein